MSVAGSPAGAAGPRLGRAAALLEDGSLVLRADPEVAALAAPWVPRALPVAGRRPGAALIRLAAAPPPAPAPDGAPEIEVLRVRGWVDRRAQRVHLASADGHVGGRVHLARLAAEIRVHPGSVGPQAEDDLYCALTVAAALLLGRQGRVLLHSGAVAAPDGRAWLLVGDSRSGKSSTCAALIRGGRDYLSDDVVVVREDRADGLVVEGWLRRFNLDDGFAEGTPSGRRAPVDPARLGPGRWRRSAPLGGLLLPRVRAGEPTVLEPVPAAEALGQVIRQSPWLLADAAAAPRLLVLMSRLARLPRRRLRLGADAYANPARLLDCLDPAFGGGARVDKPTLAPVE